MLSSRQRQRPHPAPFGASARPVHPGPLLALLTLLAALLLSSPLALAAQEEPAPPSTSGPALIARTLAAQNYDLHRLYTPPAEGRENGFTVLGHARTDLRLATGATSFCASGRGLAVGRANGTLSAYGPMACNATSADENEDNAVVLLGYGEGARYALAVSEPREFVSVYDLAECGLEERLELPGAVSVAVSRTGAWRAVALADGTVLAGPGGAGMKPLPLTLDSPLGVGFGPDQGVLFLVSASGEVVLWNLLEGAEMDRIDISGGPFASVVFADERMALAGESGTPAVSFDLAARKEIPYTARQACYYLNDGDLFYRTYGPVLRAEEHADGFRLRAFHSEARRMVAVDDPDGAQRCYSTTTGERTACGAAPDWERIELGDRAQFALGSERYLLADTVFQNNHDVLLARWTEEGGWLLWWVRDERLREFNPLPGHLPQRKSILASRPAPWAPMTPPPGFP